MANLKTTYEFTRENDDGTEQDLKVRVEITPGCRGTRIDPPEAPTFDILSAKDESGKEVPLTDEEIEHIEGGAEGEISDQAQDEDDGRAEDAWDARNDR